ncbi:hypothetical protein D3C71_1598520 [compost metagenome]
MSTTDELEKPRPLPAGTAPRKRVMSFMFSMSNKSPPPLPLANPGSPAMGRPLTVRPICEALFPRTRMLNLLPRPLESALCRLTDGAICRAFQGLLCAGPPNVRMPSRPIVVAVLARLSGGSTMGAGASPLTVTSSSKASDLSALPGSAAMERVGAPQINRAMAVAIGVRMSNVL